MEWIKTSAQALEILRDGTVAWCYSRDLKKCYACVWDSQLQRWKHHDQEHFYASGITKFIILPLQ